MIMSKSLTDRQKSIIARTRFLREKSGLTQTQIAEKMGITRDAYSKYETRSVITSGSAPLFCEALGISESLLFSGSAELPSQTPDPQPAKNIRTNKGCSHHVEILGEDYVNIPGYDIRAAAGAGALGGPESVDYYHLFRMQWLRAMTHSPIDRLAVIQVDGDSMEPTLHSGDHVLIDRDQAGFSRDGIYALDIGDGLQVKRCAMHPTDRTLTIKSDNPTYPVWSDINPDRVHFVGRVIWLGRKV